jgi:hypothetical protein
MFFFAGARVCMWVFRCYFVFVRVGGAMPPPRLAYAPRTCMLHRVGLCAVACAPWLAYRPVRRGLCAVACLSACAPWPVRRGLCAVTVRRGLLIGLCAVACAPWPASPAPLPPFFCFFFFFCCVLRYHHYTVFTHLHATAAVDDFDSSLMFAEHYRSLARSCCCAVVYCTAPT